MFDRRVIPVSELMLDTENFRIGTQESQKAAREAIIVEQGGKLANLATDICENGMNPTDLPIVVPNPDGTGYTVVEGNRRTLAVKMVLEPSLADGSTLIKKMVPLNKKYADTVAKEFLCVVAPSKKAAMPWIRKKHASGLEGAGTEPWSPLAKDRADALDGARSPSLAVYNFVLGDPKLDSELRERMEAPRFNYSTIGRLVGDTGVQRELGLKVRDGKVSARVGEKRLRELLTGMLTVIATGKKDGRRWTVRDIDKDEDRRAFAAEIVQAHGGKGKSVSPWEVAAAPSGTANRRPASSHQRPTTDDRVALVPRDCKLTIPSGKINDLFRELKTLKLADHRNAVGILFRVFLELTADDYLARRAGTAGIPLAGDKLGKKLTWVVRDVETSGLMTQKEATPIRNNVNDGDSYLNAQVLNSFVHNPNSIPDPVRLKIAWQNAQLFFERIWKP